MTVGAIAAATRARLSPADRAGRFVLAGCVLAWVALVAMASAPSPEVAHHAGHAHSEMALDPWTTEWIATWLLMVVAMMWPLAVPTVNRVWRAAYPRWRVRLALTVMATVTVLWLAFGLVVGTAAMVTRVAAGSVWWQLAFLAVAAVAWRSARRARVLWRCVKLPPVAPGGLRGLGSASRAGLVAWRRCAVLCGPLMVAMAVGHTLAVLVAASLSAWWETRHPRAWRDPVPLALLGVAALGAVGAAVMAP
jgi:hypothetical protein